MKNPWSFVIVNGYGTHLKKELMVYIDEVRKFVLEKDPAYLIFSGAETQKATAIGVTEARLMAEYFLLRWPSNRTLPEIILDEFPYTTLENVIVSVKTIRSTPGIASHWKEVKVYAFCETQRSLKTQCLYWLALPEIRQKGIGHRVWVQTSSWELDSPFKEIGKLLLDVAAFKFKPLAAWARRKRIRRSETI